MTQIVVAALCMASVAFVVKSPAEIIALIMRIILPETAGIISVLAAAAGAANACFIGIKPSLGDSYIPYGLIGGANIAIPWLSYCYSFLLFVSLLLL